MVQLPVLTPNPRGSVAKGRNWGLTPFHKGLTLTVAVGELMSYRLGWDGNQEDQEFPYRQSSLGFA